MHSAFGTLAPRRFDSAVLALTGHLPSNWLGERLAILLRRVVTARLVHDGALDVTRFGLRMRLHPRDNGCEKNLLCTPQMFETVELQALAEALQGKPATFIDIGANVGLFSLYVASIAPSARIVAIEPEPGNLERLRFNLQSNPGVSIEVVPAAVSDLCGDVEVILDRKDRGGTRTAKINGHSCSTAPCFTLLHILHERNISSVDALKIDIEGAEDVALIPFFRAAPSSLWPRLVILEDTRALWRGDLFAELDARDYVAVARTKLNIILRRR